MVVHPIPPEYDKESKILILGSFPSVKSRESGFFYGHPQNRFWKILVEIFQEPPLVTIEEKKKFLHTHHIALWDVIHSCDIEGSSDSSIKNVMVNDILWLLNQTRIEKIITNGKKASSLYQKYFKELIKIKEICLPSTSPANAVWHFEKLVEKWREELEM